MSNIKKSHKILKDGTHVYTEVRSSSKHDKNKNVKFSDPEDSEKSESEDSFEFSEPERISEISDFEDEKRHHKHHGSHKKHYNLKGSKPEKSRHHHTKNIKNGKDGKDGAIGATGPNGKDGTRGDNGKDGIDGAIGATGNTGADGKDGTTGATGASSPGTIVTLNSGTIVNLVNNTSSSGNPQNPALVSIIGLSNCASNIPYNSGINLNGIPNPSSLYYLSPIDGTLSNLSVQFQFTSNLNMGSDISMTPITGTLYFYIYQNHYPGTSPTDNFFIKTDFKGSITVNNKVQKYQNYTILSSCAPLEVSKGDRIMLIVGNGLSSENIITQFSGYVSASLNIT